MTDLSALCAWQLQELSEEELDELLKRDRPKKERE